MNQSVIMNALGEIQQTYSRARSALRDIAVEIYGAYAEDDQFGGYEYPKAALGGLLQELYDVLLVVLEAADLPETRATLVRRWAEFQADEGGLERTIDDEDHEVCHSPALEFLRHLIDGLRVSTTKGASLEEAWIVSRLDEILRSTAALVRRRSACLQDEHQLQRIMHDYLQVCFSGFTDKPQVGGTLKNFKPDCGILDVGAAIEFKIVHSKEEAALAFSGITEDSAGYKGSKDWTRFYAVIYQAEPFILESHIRHDLKRIGAATWIPILANGSTTPRIERRRRKALNGKDQPADSANNP